MLTIAEEWLNSCSGCEIAVLNLGETLLDVLPRLNIVHMPVLVDNKYHGPLGTARLDIPPADVGFVSGGVRNTEHVEVLRRMRARVKVLVALGSCAATGGLPGLGNLCGVEALQDAAFAQAPSLGSGPHARPYVCADAERDARPGVSSDVRPDACPAACPDVRLAIPPDVGLPDLGPARFGAPRQGIPSLLPQCTPLSAHVPVDLVLPGCPPHPDWIAETVLSLLEGRPAVLPDRSVCSLCPARRSAFPGRRRGRVRRMLEQPVYDAEKPLSHMQCLLEQGFLCLGPVTLAGCGGRTGAPRCIAARTPCRGCQGPVGHGSLAAADYMGALAAAGINGADMPDKPGYLSRFHAAHAGLRQLLEEQAHE